MDDEELFEENFDEWIGSSLRDQVALISWPIYFLLKRF